MKQVLKIAFISSFLLIVLAVSMFAQFSGTLENIQSTTDVRKGSTIQYSVDSLYQAGDAFRWEIIGGVPTPTPSSGSGTDTDPYIIDFTVDLDTISVTWNADDHTATAFNGRVRVQKRSSGGCFTAIQTQNVNAWSAVTAAITTPAPGAICNGENVGLTVTVTFTGAPVFDLDYTIVNNLPVTPVTTNETLTEINGNNASITIPDHLINETNADQTYTITITRIGDIFDVSGTLGTNTYTLTVHPATSTGTIKVSPGSLQRR